MQGVRPFGGSRWDILILGGSRRIVTPENKIPVVRLRLGCETTAEFYANYAKRLASDFFVAQELDLTEGRRTLVRVTLPALGLRLYGEGSARPAEKSGRRGVIIRLHKLESDGVKLPLLEMNDAAADHDHSFDDAVTRASQLPQELANELRKRLNMRVSPTVVPRQQLRSQSQGDADGQDDEDDEVKDAEEVTELNVDPSEFKLSEFVKGISTGPIPVQEDSNPPAVEVSAPEVDDHHNPEQEQDLDPYPPVALAGTPDTTDDAPSTRRHAGTVVISHAGTVVSISLLICAILVLLYVLRAELGLAW